MSYPTVYGHFCDYYLGCFYKDMSITSKIDVPKKHRSFTIYAINLWIMQILRGQAAGILHALSTASRSRLAIGWY